MEVSTPHLRYKEQTPRERTWTIHLIAAEKAVKGTVLVIIACKLLTLIGSDVHEWAMELVARHGIDAGNRYVQAWLERLVGVGNTELIQFSTIAFLYAALLFVEATGLWMQKRWGEYLAATATALLLPVEVYELCLRFTWVRIVVLAVNIFVVWYLVTRLRDEKRFGRHRLEIV